MVAGIYVASNNPLVPVHPDPMKVSVWLTPSCSQTSFYSLHFNLVILLLIATPSPQERALDSFVSNVRPSVFISRLFLIYSLALLHVANCCFPCHTRGDKVPLKGVVQTVVADGMSWIKREGTGSRKSGGRVPFSAADVVTKASQNIQEDRLTTHSVEERPLDKILCGSERNCHP